MKEEEELLKVFEVGESLGKKTDTTEVIYLCFDLICKNNELFDTKVMDLYTVSNR